jgi:hypothetical protein
MVTVEPESFVELVIWNIRRNWDDLFQAQSRHSNAELVGILRTILSSVETWATPSPDSRGYLSYIEGFLAQGGVRPRLIPMDDDRDQEPESPSDEQLLLDLGQVWLEIGSNRAKGRFFKKGLAMIDEGQADAVINVCQKLIGQRNEEAFVEELSELLQPAYRKLGVPFGKGPSQWPKNLFGAFNEPD